MRSLNETALVKLRAMHGKMLKEKEYLEMLNCKNISEILAYLKNNTHYKKSLQNLEEKIVEKEKIEDILKKHEINNKNKIFKYVKENKILNILLKQDEISKILNSLLLILTNSTEKSSSYYENEFEKKLKKATTFEELLNILKNTKYHKILKKFNFKNNAENLNYFKIEFDLYNSFFKNLLKSVKSHSKNVELFELNRLIKTKIELINLCNIYRKKFLIQEPENEVKFELFPFNKNLNKKDLHNILENKTKLELEENYKKIYKKIKDFKIENVENYSTKIECEISKHYIHISFNITTVFYCYLILQKIEISNLIKIIEGICYNISKEKIKDLLII